MQSMNACRREKMHLCTAHRQLAPAALVVVVVAVPASQTMIIAIKLESLQKRKHREEK